MPPKQPGGQRSGIVDTVMSYDAFEDEEDENENESAVPVKGILTLEASNGNVHVVRNELKVSFCKCKV